MPATAQAPDRIDVAARRPTGDEADFLAYLDRLHDEGERARDHWAPPDALREHFALLRGEVGPKKRFFSLNFIDAFIDRMVAQLTDNRPILRINSRKAGLRGVARALDRAIRTLWDEADVQRQTFVMAHLAAVMGSAGLYVAYDPSNDEIVLETVRLDQVVIDPKAREAARIGSTADYLMIERIVSLDELRMRFPGRGGSVEPDAHLSDIHPVKQGQAMESPLLDVARRDDERPGAAVPRALVTEIWTRDWRKTASGDLMFPGGRLTFRTRDLILWDGPNPYWDGRWPLDWYDWGTDPQHLWGRSEVAGLRHLQLPFNQLLDGLVRNQLLTNIVTLIAEWDAFPPEVWRKLQQLEDTLILRKQNRNATPQLQMPPTFGTDKLAIARQLFTFGQLRTGVTDVTLGETPGSLQSGLAIEGLQEGANLMTRARASRLEDLYARIGQKLIARVFQFYTLDRMAGLLGPTMDAEEYGRKRQELFFQRTATGLEPTSPEQRRRALNDFRLSVAPGSSAPGTRQRRAQLMLELHAAGLASGLDALEAADFPEPREMLERAQAEQALRAQANIPPPPPPSGRGGRRT